MYPEIAADGMSIYTNGADPKYEALPPTDVPTGGYPHALGVLRESRINAGCCGWTEGNSVRRKIDDILREPGLHPNYGFRKRLPGRTPIYKSRTISDIRRINLGRDNRELLPILAPEIKDR